MHGVTMKFEDLNVLATPVSVEERWEQTVRGTRTYVTQDV